MKHLTIAVTFFITIFLVCLLFGLATMKALNAEEIITDADVSYHEYTVLTDMEDALINSMRVNYHYEWEDYGTVITTVTVKATVK